MQTLPSCSMSKMAKNSALAIVIACLPLAVHASVTLDVRDGGTGTAKISIKDPTRVRVEGARITDVIGSAVRTEKNPMGSLTVSVDESKGEIFIQPSGIKATPSATSIFVSTEQATYTLVLVPLDIPADTIVLRDRTTLAAPAPGKRLPNHERELISILKSVANRQPPQGMTETRIVRPVSLWREARFTLMRRYEGHPRWAVEVFDLTNITEQSMVLDEREFLTDGVAAVALEQTILAPGETVPVRIVREVMP